MSSTAEEALVSLQQDSDSGSTQAPSDTDSFWSDSDSDDDGGIGDKDYAHFTEYVDHYESPDLPEQSEGWEISFTVFEEDMKDPNFDIRNVVAQCFNTSEARKRGLEVKESLLSPKELECFKAARAREWGAWLDNEVIELASRHTVDPSRLMSCRWVMTWKQPEAENESGDTSHLTGINPTLAEAVHTKRPGCADSEARDKKLKKSSTMPDGRTAKARLVLRGFQDPDIGSFSTMAPVLGRVSRSTLWAVAAHKKWSLLTLDARTAFLAGEKTARTKPLFATLPARTLQELALDPDTVMKLRKVPYGLCEEPLAWYRRLCDALRDCGWTQSQCDPCLWTLRASAEGHKGNSVEQSLPIVGICGVHVDDLLLSGEGAAFEASLRRLCSTLPFGVPRYGRMKFCGMEI